VRTGSVGNTGTIDSAYNSADQLTSTTKSGQSTTYTYDANGNQAASGARTFSYDLASRLASTTNAGTTTTYSYDGEGRRISSTVGGGGADLRYVWDPLAESGLPELALERTSAGSLVRRYLAGPLGAFSFTNPSATFSYHRDPLGTVTDVTNSPGAAQWKYEYEAYGAERTTTNVSGTAPENRDRFNGQYLDPETTQYHLRARQYDPVTGRFGALDPVEDLLSAPYDGAYIYVNGRPTLLVDPLGLYSRNEFKRDVTGAADAVATIGDFRAHVEFWGDQAQSGAQRGGVLGLGQRAAGEAGAFVLSPFAEISSGTETLWDPCASGSEKLKGAGLILLGMASVTPPGRAIRSAGAAAEGVALGRRGAFGAAKRRIGVPRTQQPTSLGPAYDKAGNVIPGGRTYRFGEGPDAPYITNHPPTKYPDGGSQPWPLPSKRPRGGLTHLLWKVDGSAPSLKNGRLSKSMEAIRLRRWRCGRNLARATRRSLSRLRGS
jgi:RHS repeat-associated protein